MRSLTAETLAAVAAPVVRGIYLIAIFFDELTVAWHSGPSDIDYGGHTYRATGSLGSVGRLNEKPGVVASSLGITIGGIKPEITALLMATNYLGRPVIIHYALLDEANQFSADRCVQVFSGRLDAIKGTQGKAAFYDITVASRLSDWERQRRLVYNDADQQRLYPGDRGMEYVAQLSEMKLIWPRAKFLPDARG